MHVELSFNGQLRIFIAFALLNFGVTFGLADLLPLFFVS
jgi:hypothetical protein